MALLQTLTNDIIQIVEYSGKVYHLSTGGVNVFSSALDSLAHVTTLGDTIGVNDYGLYIGGTSGVYFISHASLGSGGDVTSSVVLQFTTGTTPALASNTVWALAGKGTALMIATNTTLQFLPNSSLTTIHNTGNFGINKLAMSNSQDFLALASDSRVYTMDIPVGAFSSADARQAEGITSIFFDPGITVPAAIDSSTYYIDWMNSHPGQYMVAEGLNPNVIRFFDYNNGAPIERTVSAQPTYASWMVYGAHPTLPILFCWSQAGFAYIYEIVGTTLTLQSTIAATTMYGQDGAWSTDGTHYAVASNSGLALFSYIDGVLTAHGTVAGDYYRVVWSSENPNVVVAARNQTIKSFERVGNTLVHRSTSTVASTGNLSEDLGRIVVVPSSNSIVADVFRISGTSLVKETSLASAPGVTQGYLLSNQANFRQRGFAVRLVSYGATWFLRALGGQVSFIPGNCGMHRGEPGVWNQPLYHMAIDHAKTIAFLHLGNAHIWCPIRVTEIAPLGAAVNAIAAGEDVYIGTSDGLAVRPRVIVKRNMAHMDHNLAINRVAGTEGKNITAVAVRGSATKDGGTIVYGHDTGGGEAGILDIGELS